MIPRKLYNPILSLAHLKNLNRQFNHPLQKLQNIHLNAFLCRILSLTQPFCVSLTDVLAFRHSAWPNALPGDPFAESPLQAMCA